MSKFYVGQKVFVRDSTFVPCPGSKGMVEKFGFIKDVDGSTYGVWNEDKSDWFGFSHSDLLPINETPETLTINGVEYIRKPEPEHEWKFGDIAVSKTYGTVFVGGKSNGVRGYIWIITDKGVGDQVPPSTLTFICRADLSV